MGYNTDFQGHFTLTPALDVVTFRRLQELDGADPHDFPHNNGMPGSYNQWQLTADGQGLQWDGNEKFYHYVEWLQYLIDHVLAHAGITVSGAVHYYGEEPTDSGVLTVVDGHVVRQKNALVNAEDLDELQAFMAFALESDDGGKLATAWQEQKRRKKSV